MSMAASPPVSSGPPALVVMGVSGAGKTTFGRALADALSVVFIDGDDLHPASNVAKMAAGTPLVDEDRWPWLDRVAAVLSDEAAHPAGVVVACSALKRVYRDRIRTATRRIRFVFLEAGRDAIEHRLEERTAHFMPIALVKSQFETLERPTGEVDVLTVSAMGHLDETVRRTVAWVASNEGRSTQN